MENIVLLMKDFILFLLFLFFFKFYFIFKLYIIVLVLPNKILKTGLGPAKWVSKLEYSNEIWRTGPMCFMVISYDD